jgi:uncharacterized protein (TIGR02270 family)
MPIPVVVTQHAEEAAFLWLLRDGAVRRPHFKLRSLAGLDDRVEAHLDGLRVAGEHGWVLCRECLPLEDAGEIFALASVALDGGRGDRIDEVVTAASADPSLARGIVSALAWLPPARAEREIAAFMGAPDPFRRRTAISASACLRRDPGRPLLDAASDPDPRLRARALRALGELGLIPHLGLARAGLDAADSEVRFWSSWTCAILSSAPDAVERLMVAASKPGPFQARGLDLAARRLALPDAVRWRESLAADPASRRLAVTLAGQAGDPAALPWLIELMNDPPLARGALEAFVFVTGADVDNATLEGPAPEAIEPVPTDDPEDENVRMEPDDDLPWPHPPAVAAWWRREARRFVPGKRFLLGQQLTPEWTMEVLRSGSQRHRAAAALEITIRSPGRPLFNVVAPGFRQQSDLSART